MKLLIGNYPNNLEEVFSWIDRNDEIKTEWLGKGNASKEIIKHIKVLLS
jgi:hypothetical protein